MISVPESRRTTQLPSRCSPFLEPEKWSIWPTWRSPTTMSASPARIGATSLATSAPRYWLSASVLTTTSAPSFRQASRPAWKPAARPLLLVSRTMCSTPFSRATSTVRSVEPSSIDQQLDRVEAVDLARQVGDRRRERRFLVQAGDLDDQLHRDGSGYPGGSARGSCRRCGAPACPARCSGQRDRAVPGLEPRPSQPPGCACTPHRRHPRENRLNGAVSS